MDNIAKGLIRLIRSAAMHHVPININHGQSTSGMIVVSPASQMPVNEADMNQLEWWKNTTTDEWVTISDEPVRLV